MILVVIQCVSKLRICTLQLEFAFAGRNNVIIHWTAEATENYCAGWLLGSVRVTDTPVLISIAPGDKPLGYVYNDTYFTPKYDSQITTCWNSQTGKESLLNVDSFKGLELELLELSEMSNSSSSSEYISAR